MESEGIGLAPERLAAVVGFIGECQRIEQPKLDDICGLLRRLQSFDFEQMTLGVCRLEQQRAEFITSIQISADCLQQGGSCSPSAGRSIPTLPRRATPPPPLACQPKRFAPIDAVQGGLIFCQSSPLGSDYASCLFIEQQPEELSGEQQAILQLVIPHLLHLAQDLNELGTLFAQLTEREREVLRWVGAGKSNWEIARILAISERTAKYHISNILAKLGLSNRVQAAAFAALLPKEER